MKYFGYGFQFVSLVSALSFCAAVVIGQERPRATEERPTRPGAEGERRLAGLLERVPLIAALDTNGDGELSAEEIQNATAALRKLDTNGDGKLSRDEWLPRLPLLQDAAPALRRAIESVDPAQLLERLMPQGDANGDGKLTREELPERIRNALQGRLANLFDTVDANKDGALDRQELRTLLERLPRPGLRGGDRPGAARPEGGPAGGSRPERDRP